MAEGRNNGHCVSVLRLFSAIESAVLPAVELHYSQNSDNGGAGHRWARQMDGMQPDGRPTVLPLQEAQPPAPATPQQQTVTAGRWIWHALNRKSRAVVILVLRLGFRSGILSERLSTSNNVFANSALLSGDTWCAHARCDGDDGQRRHRRRSWKM